MPGPRHESGGAGWRKSGAAGLCCGAGRRPRPLRAAACLLARKGAEDGEVGKSAHVWGEACNELSFLPRVGCGTASEPQTRRRGSRGEGLGVALNRLPAVPKRDTSSSRKRRLPWMGLQGEETRNVAGAAGHAGLEKREGEMPGL